MEAKFMEVSKIDKAAESIGTIEKGLESSAKSVDNIKRTTH
jgi:hypothetical protein